MRGKMSKPANKTMIGAFVVGGLVLALLAVIVFGSGKFLRKTIVYVMYFEGSVKGLNVGSPVVFRGVKIGSVKEVELEFDEKDFKVLIPVYVEIDPAKIKATKGAPEDGGYMDELIRRGLRAQLELQSIVTGQLMINVDFFANKPAKLVGMDTKHREIPTVSSPLDELLKAAQELPLKDLFDRAVRAIEGLEKVVNSPKVSASLDELSESLKESRKILAKIDKELDPVLTNIKGTLDSVQRIAAKAETVPPQLDKTLAAAQGALKQAENTLTAVQEVVSENSVMAQETGETLRELSNAARSVRFLTDYLQRHPEALLRGKKPPKGE
ncbi:MAG: Paraquat-inducible protein B [Syntrophorhabdus sp. PtaU1.Bin153]|nr:MAG: Paraquat-inducible protein B [Syntrophorhabdus sp. PtaU1.Bin153]